MRVVVSGSSGLVGSRLVLGLRSAGHDVVRLVRDPEAAAACDAHLWEPASGTLEPAVLEDADAVVNLNGRSIAAGRWTGRVRQELRSSRLDPTGLLARAIAAAERPPRVLVSASAVGYYGHRGEEVLGEAAPPGRGFLAELACAWEEAALAARGAGTRVVLLRLGMVVADGGALARMLPVFRLGLGGPLGSGAQWWPWVALEDVVSVVELTLGDERAEGPLNVVSPGETRCRDFAAALGRHLGRPARLPAPAFALRLVLGEMADALLLASTRARPERLCELGYEFRAPRLDQALVLALDSDVAPLE